MSQVTHPSHYNAGKIEVIEAIEDWKLGFHRGNAVKYTARAGRKNADKEIEDLEKAIWYLNREIELVRAKKEGREPRRPNDMNPRESSSVTPALSSAPTATPAATASVAARLALISLEGLVLDHLSAMPSVNGVTQARAREEWRISLSARMRKFIVDRA